MGFWLIETNPLVGPFIPLYAIIFRILSGDAARCPLPVRIKKRQHHRSIRTNGNNSHAADSGSSNHSLAYNHTYSQHNWRTRNMEGES